MSERKIAVWGTGNMALSIMKFYPDFQVEVFIDSFTPMKTFCGKRVVRPSDINAWKTYYVVVAIQAYDTIKKELLSFGLEETKDFCDYKSYLHLELRSLYETIEYLKEFLEKRPEYRNADFWGGHFFTGRKPEMHIDFFSQYANTHSNRKYLCVAHTSCLSEQRVEELMGVPFVNLPDITNWQGYARERFDYQMESDEMSMYELSEDEKRYAQELQEIYPIDNKKESYKVCCLIMKFYREFLHVLQPRAILIGTDIKPEYRILYYYADKMGIPARFWEYGWIPGTLMFLEDGTAGRSRMATDKSYYDSLSNDYSEENIREIKQYIIDSQIDTTSFKKTEEDQIQLERLDKTKKTVFLVGQGIEVNVTPGCTFWKENISSCFDSMKDILQELIKVCEKNDYNLLYKPHPGLSTFKVDEKIDTSSVIQIRDASVDELIEISDVVVSLYSAVDCKSLLYGRPVVAIGSSIMNYAGCAYRVVERKELAIKVRQAVEDGMTAEQEKQFDSMIGKCLSNIMWDDLQKKDICYGLLVKDDFF